MREHRQQSRPEATHTVTAEEVEAATRALNEHYADSPEPDDDHRECIGKILAALGVTVADTPTQGGDDT